MIKSNILELITIIGILILLQSIQVCAQDELPPSLTIIVGGKVYDFEGSPSKGAVVEIITPEGLWQCKTNDEGLYYSSEVLASSGDKVTVKVNNADKTESGTISHIMTNQEDVDRQINMPNIALSSTESINSEEINTKNESGNILGVSTKTIKSNTTPSQTSNQTLSPNEESIEVTKESTNQVTKTEDNSSTIKEKEAQTKPETNDLKPENNNLWWMVILIIIIILLGVLVMYIWKKRNE